MFRDRGRVPGHRDEGGDGAGQDAVHMGVVEQDEFTFGIGKGSEGHHKLVTALMTFHPLPVSGEIVHVVLDEDRAAGPKTGRVRLLIRRESSEQDSHLKAAQA
jgi:hypothetical protein